jgi:predicted dienelactone hydrolase
MRTPAGAPRGDHSPAPPAGGPPADRRRRPARQRRRALLGAGTAVVLAAAGLGTFAAVSSPDRHPQRATGRPSVSAPVPSVSASTPTRRARPPRPPAIGAIGGHRVATLTLRLTRRPRGQPGPRVLLTAVWYPARSGLAGGPFPLVVFAPGYLQCASAYRPLLRAWASAGYIVAAPDFPRTSCHVPDPAEDDLANQPADMAFVISRLVAAGRQPHGSLAGLVDPARIAVAGHSDGGDTVTALAAGSCCRDRAVRAAIVLAGAEWPPLGGSYFGKGTPPILFVQGSADTINPPPDSLAMYRADAAGPRFYLDLPGAGHLAPYEGRRPPEPLVARVTVDFLDRYLSGQRAGAAAMRRAGRVRGSAVLVGAGRLPP